MAAGIRIWHPKARDGVFTFSLNRRPYQTWNRRLKKREDYALACLHCGKMHVVKTYHLKLDVDGFAIVSQEIWQNMTEHGNGFGFQLANQVLSPPPQIIRVGGPVEKIETQELPEA